MAQSKARQLWTKGALAASTVAAAGAGATGLASAQAVISTTGPGSYNAITSNNSSDGHGSNYHVNDWYGQDLSWANDWNSWSPYNWQNQGHSFNDWYNNCHRYLSSHAAAYYPWSNNNYGGGYGGDSWDSWNPQNYQNHSGTSYSGWYYQMMRYMENHYNQWQNNWSGGYGGDSYSNNDHNNYTSSYHNNNYGGRGASGYATLASYDNNDGRNNYGGYGGNNYNDNFSSNRRTVSNTVNTNVRNNNDVTVTNNNPQTAQTGSVNVSRNTRVSDVSSGNATNESQANFDVNVSNDTNLPSGGMGGNTYGSDHSSVYNSGYNSRNTLNLNNRQTTNVTNTNSVDVTNNNRQTARTGNVSASRNTWVGSAYSGDASNYSSADFNVSADNTAN